MPTVMSNREKTKKHNGKTVVKVRSVTEDDGESHDPTIAKTVVEDEQGEQFIVHNSEIVD